MPRNRRPAAWAWTVVVAIVLVGPSVAARADLISLWRLDETAGTVAANSVSWGTAGTLTNGPVWTDDAQRGRVLQFDGNDDYVSAGKIPALAAQEDFTWAFWARQTRATTENDFKVIVGNRYGGPADNSWVKFTPVQFEYRETAATHLNLGYSGLAANEWVHHAVVKQGTTLSYYRNGEIQGTRSIAFSLPGALPFYLGGDARGERWQGQLDDVALFNEALTPAQLQTVQSGDFRPFLTPSPTKLVDYFSGAQVDSVKWTVVNQGLQSTANGGYDEPAVAGGVATLGGTSTVNYWAGKTLRSNNVFQVPEAGEIRFDVDRVSLTGTGRYRSSMWMYQDASHFLHFAQDIGEDGWQFNAGNNNPDGRGVNLARADSLDVDTGRHKMTLIHDGAYVKMFLDGQYLGSQAANFETFRVMLTGQARAAGDTVSAAFDNVNVATRQLPHLYDDFNAPAINPAKWTVVNKGLENQGNFTGNLTATVTNGELVFGDPTGLNPAGTGQQYWYGVSLRTVPTFQAAEQTTFAVDRDAILRGGTGDSLGVKADRSGIWLWADDTHYLFFGHNWGENGWQYNYADGSRIQQVSTGGGINLTAFDSLDQDSGRHEMKLVFRPVDSTVFIDLYLDGILGATQRLDNWGDRAYYFMLSGMPRSSGDLVYAAFDNVRIWVPEPSTWALLILGGLGLLWGRRGRVKPGVASGP